MKKLMLVTMCIVLLTNSVPAYGVLAKYWRLRMQSGSAMETLTYDNAARIVIRLSPWKMVSGNLSYGTTVTTDLDFHTGDTIAADAEVEISDANVIDNTSNLYWGIKGYFEIKADVNPTIGVCRLFLEESDDNTNWPSDQEDFDCDEDLRLVCVLQLSTDAEDESRGKNFEF